jgi:prepilin-type N-terminal cleavage/methylation domain-containing protein
MKNRSWQVRNKGYITGGFTLLEVLVVIIIIGILFAIAAPGWNALINRQRVNVVRDQAIQIIRQAQSDARRTQRSRIVVFDNTTGIPRVATFAITSDQTSDFPDIPTDGITNWQTLGNGEIRSNVLSLETVPADAKGKLVFKSTGALDDVSVKAGKDANVPNVLFGVNISQRNTSSQTRRCIVVTTLLGATRLAEGDNCPT